MKLHNVPRNSKIKVKFGTDEVEVLDFSHVDGMYSLCFDSAGRPVHIAAWTEVEVVDGIDPGSESKEANQGLT
jgi:hypothetical protein